MSHDDLFYDYLDGLLEGDEAREAEARIAGEPARFAEIARRRALLYRPYPVAPPPAAAPRRLPGFARYAAAFLLGVVTPLLLPEPPNPPNTPTEPEPAALEVTNRRLR
jgi:anti-sigma factor RsiW